MKKRHKQLLRKILKEEIGSTQSHAGHEWTVENPHEVFGRLPEAQQNKVRELYHSGRLHPELLHPHGWRPGTGPVFGRDFHGRSAEDYRRLHGQVRDNLIQKLGRSRGQAHADATAHVEQLRARAEEEGQGTHAMHMREINISRREAAQREQERRRADTNTRGAVAQESYRRDSESLFHSAMKGASDSAHYFRTGGEAERAEEQRRGMINIDVRHPQLSDAARRHLGTLTDISRRAMHSTVIGGLNAARPAFREDAVQHWRRTFSGMGTPPGVRGEHDILHSLLTPEALRDALKHYNHPIHGAGSAAQFVLPTTAFGDESERLEPPYHPIGHHHAPLLRTGLHPSQSIFHPSVVHLHLNSMPQAQERRMRENGILLDRHSGVSNPSHRPTDRIGSKVHTSMYPIYLGKLVGRAPVSPFRDDSWKTKHPSTSDEEHKFDQAVGQGLKHIWSIPDISDSDRLHLHRHFESQLRHHYLASVANPRMFDQHHRAVEDAQREQARQQGGQQSSSGDSSSRSTGSQRVRRPAHEIGTDLNNHLLLRSWPHTIHPQDVLGLQLTKEKIEDRKIKIEHLHPFNGADSLERKVKAVREAHARLSAEHDPTKGGDPAKHKMIQDALAHYERAHALESELKETVTAEQEARKERDKRVWKHQERPHEILGIPQNATADQIKKAFKALSIKHHPDQGGNEEHFKKISDAYEHMKNNLSESFVSIILEWHKNYRQKKKRY